jgi:hypothetical protein
MEIISNELSNELNDELNDELSNELNDDWIINFEKTDQLYENFYKDNLYYVNLKLIYLNRENEIEKIKQEPFLMTTPNYISREQILGILKKTINEDNKHYTLISILKYNISIEPDDIQYFLMKTIDPNFLTIVKNIDAITFEKSIHMFHDLNDLMFIFYEKSKSLKKLDHNKCTKKIYLNNLRSNKKTIKKRYKE